MKDFRTYVDLDGTLADIETHYRSLFGLETSKTLDNIDWKLISEQTDPFYFDLPLMPDALQLWAGVEQYAPIILTGCPKLIFDRAAEDKRRWVAHHFGSHVSVICCASADKATYCEPGDVLIDDWTKYRDRWIDRGGVFIEHISAEQSLNEYRSYRGKA